MLCSRLTRVLLVWLWVVTGFTGVNFAGEDGPTILTNANVIDCTGTPVKSGMTVVVMGDSITALYQGRPRQSDLDGGGRVVDLGGAYVLPGFWNMHTHLSEVFPDNPDLAGEPAHARVVRAGINAMLILPLALLPLGAGIYLQRKGFHRYSCSRGYFLPVACL